MSDETTKLIDALQVACSIEGECRSAARILPGIGSRNCREALVKARKIRRELRAMLDANLADAAPEGETQ